MSEKALHETVLELYNTGRDHALLRMIPDVAKAVEHLELTLDISKEQRRQAQDRVDDLERHNRELRDRCESERARADSNAAWAQLQIVESRQAERVERARCAKLFDAWTERWRYDPTWEAGDLAAAIQNGNTVEECDATTLELTGDQLHPTGRCVCCGEGRCGWCHGARRRERIAEEPAL